MGNIVLVQVLLLENRRLQKVRKVIDALRQATVLAAASSGSGCTFAMPGSGGLGWSHVHWNGPIVFLDRRRGPGFKIVESSGWTGSRRR
jgi:hypothetical protein